MHCSQLEIHTLTGPLWELERACGKDGAETILRSAATGAHALNKDEVTREDALPVTVRNETGMESEEPPYPPPRPSPLRENCFRWLQTYGQINQLLHVGLVRIVQSASEPLADTVSVKHPSIFFFLVCFYSRLIIQFRKK